MTFYQQHFFPLLNYLVDVKGHLVISKNGSGEEDENDDKYRFCVFINFFCFANIICHY